MLCKNCGADDHIVTCCIKPPSEGWETKHVDAASPHQPGFQQPNVQQPRPPRPSPSAASGTAVAANADTEMKDVSTTDRQDDPEAEPGLNAAGVNDAKMVSGRIVTDMAM